MAQFNEDQIRHMQQIMADILNAPHGAGYPIDENLRQLVKLGFEAVVSPRPKLVFLGIVDVDKWHEMQRGNARFCFLRPRDSHSPGWPKKRMMPVYGIDTDQ